MPRSGSRSDSSRGRRPTRTNRRNARRHPRGLASSDARRLRRDRRAARDSHRRARRHPNGRGHDAHAGQRLRTRRRLSVRRRSRSIARRDRGHYVLRRPGRGDAPAVQHRQRRAARRSSARSRAIRAALHDDQLVRRLRSRAARRVARPRDRAGPRRAFDPGLAAVRAARAHARGAARLQHDRRTARRSALQRRRRCARGARGRRPAQRDR